MADANPDTATPDPVPTDTSDPTPGPAATPGDCPALPDDVVERIRATLYGQSVGDAIGLLTEFLDKKDIQVYYKKYEKQLEFEHKMYCPDFHRTRWEEGDWTDDTDQMLLIMQSLIDCDGQIKPEDFAAKLKFWTRNGFPELGDLGGMGIGRTTLTVIGHPDYLTEPHKAAFEVWDNSQRNIAPNGAVMRTSILGVHQFWDTEAVAENAINIGKTTHHDPRCQASVAAVSVAISLMLKREPQYLKKDGHYIVEEIIKTSYDAAARCLETKEQKDLLKEYMFCEKLNKLKLDEQAKIGYTYKCMGAGFWALRQKDFRKALQAIVLEGGDADTNGAVAGALLGCKLGLSALPASWVTKLKHKEWLDGKIQTYLRLLARMKDGKRMAPKPDTE